VRAQQERLGDAHLVDRLLVAVAAAIVWWKRDDMFTHSGAVMEVIPHGSATGSTT
jgi:hypothetical protein